MKNLIILILILSFAYAQNIGNLFPEESNDNDKRSRQLSQDVDLTSINNLTYTPIENPIDPNLYILGPGDLLGVNILSTKNISMPIRINPVGEIIIPSVGILNVNGISLADARTIISDYVIETAIKNAIVNVTLLDIRKFKIQILGAVYNPGFVFVTPLDKVYDAIQQSGGVQKLAHPDIVKLIRNGDTINIELREYLSGRDLSKNISLIEGDVLLVPFSDYADSLGLIPGEYNNHHVVVHGFVNSSGGSNSFRYYSGYTARDYIAMAGGIKEQDVDFRSGDIAKTTIYRSDGSRITSAADEIVLPGDIIEVPSTLPVIVFGFVNTSGGSNSFRYYEDHTVRDYIAMAGGTREQGSSFKSGNIKNAKIYRIDGTKIKNAINEIVQPGDIIEVPSSTLLQIVGGDGIIRTLASIASIASSVYIVYRVTQEK
ncbi:MAG: polysaccharide biosynthesis/export family protein [Candidatus Neomarinimicrobiota bacterium]